MPHPIELLLLASAVAYQIIASYCEDRHPPPGKRILIGDRQWHYCTAGVSNNSPTVVLDHSLGGIDGYFLIQELARQSQVFIYDRAGYGWSDPSPQPRHSDRMVAELNELLERAKIQPPYVLVGDSLGSYNVRLYAQRYPERVAALVVTDGLHEAGMLSMPWQLRAMQVVFLAGFALSALGSALGIVRLLGTIGVFELLKPELRKFPVEVRDRVKRSFYRPQHWLTMFRELYGLDASGQQLQIVRDLGNLPIMLVSASAFFMPSLWSALLPTRAANRLWAKMHQQLQQLSTSCTHIRAEGSGHFVWIDRPKVLLEAIAQTVENVRSSGED